MAQRSGAPSGRVPSAPAPGKPSFAVKVDLVTGRLTVTGRLGARTSHMLYDAVSALLRSDQPSWTVDVSELDVADHAGLRALAGAYRRALRHGRGITLHGASPALRQALIRLRLERHMLPDERAPADPGRE